MNKIGVIVVAILMWSGIAYAQESHFKIEEFKCKCCGEVVVNPVLIEKLEMLRKELGDREVVITSGYRCPKHNWACGGVARSQHMKGNAADIKVKGRSVSEIKRAARKVGFSFVKKYQSWVHVDVR